MSKPLLLETMRGGAVLEAVNHEIQVVMDNIQDPNTKADGLREVTLTLKFKPGKERNFGNVSFQAKSKTQPVEAEEVPFFVDRDRTTKKAVGLEMVPGEDPGQHRLPEVDSKVTDIKTAAKS